MTWWTGFYMLFEGDKIDEKAEQFLRVITPYCATSAKPEKYKEYSFEGYSNIDIKMHYEDCVMRGLSFSIHISRNEDLNNLAEFRFETEFSGVIFSSVENLRILNSIFLKAAAALDPLFGCNTYAIESMDPYGFVAEYYRNPYFFCVEPTIRPLSEEERKRFGIDSDVTHEFLYDKDLEAKIEEIKRVMGKEELVALLKEHCKEVVLGKQGAGVLKKYAGNDKEIYVYPRYFIRRELRRRGVQLEEGLAEKYAGELGIK